MKVIIQETRRYEVEAESAEHAARSFELADGRPNSVWPYQVARRIFVPETNTWAARFLEPVREEPVEVFPSVAPHSAGGGADARTARRIVGRRLV